MESLEVGLIPPIPSSLNSRRPCHIYCTASGDAVIYGTASSLVTRYLPGCLDPLQRPTETFTNKKAITIANCTPDGGCLIAGDDNGELTFWDVKKHRKALLFGGSDSPTSPGASAAVEIRSIQLGMPYVRMTDIQFSSDGRKVVVSGADKYSKKLASCIFTEAGNACGKIEGHTLGVYAVAFQPTKPQYIASAGADGKLLIHAGPPYKLMTRIGEDLLSEGAVFCVRFSPDGQKLAACGESGVLCFFSAASPDFPLISQIQLPPDAPVPLLGLAWSADSNRAIVAASDSSLFIVECESGDLIASMKTPETPLGVAWSPKDWVVTVTEQGRIRGYRSLEQRSFSSEAFCWQGVHGGCSCVAVDADSGRLLIGDSLGSLLFLSTNDSEPRVFDDLKLPTTVTVRCAAVAATYAAAATSDGNLRIFHLPANSETTPAGSSDKNTPEVPQISINTVSGETPPTPAPQIDAAMLSSDASNLLSRPSLQVQASMNAIAGGVTTSLPNLAVPTPSITVAAEACFKDAPLALLKICDSKSLLAVCSNGALYSYDVGGDSLDLKALWSVKLPGKITGAAASSDGNLVAISLTTSAYYPAAKFSDGRETVAKNTPLVEIYEVDDQNETGFRYVCCYETQFESTAISVSPQGTHFAVADTQRSIRVIEVETGKRVVEWTYHSTRVSCLGFSPDGWLVVSGSLDRDVFVSDLRYRDRYTRLADAHAGGTSCAQFLFNNVVLTTGNDGVIAAYEFTLPPPPEGVKPYELIIEEPDLQNEPQKDEEPVHADENDMHANQGSMHANLSSEKMVSGVESSTTAANSTAANLQSTISLKSATSQLSPRSEIPTAPTTPTSPRSVAQ